MLPDDLQFLAEQQRKLSIEETQNYSDSSTYSDSDEEEQNELFKGIFALCKVTYECIKSLFVPN